MADTYFSVAITENSHNHTGARLVFLDFQGETTDTSAIANDSITLDGGMNDWTTANLSTLNGLPQNNYPLSEFIDSTPTDIEIGAAWDDTYVYFVLSWEDAGHSLSGSENEDRILMMFPIVDGAQYFVDGGLGCAGYCHANLIIDDNPYQNHTGEGVAVMHTTQALDRADIWHWKLSRTAPAGVADDKEIVFRNDDSNGRIADTGTSAYAKNSLVNGHPTLMDSSGLSSTADALAQSAAVNYYKGDCGSINIVDISGAFGDDPAGIRVVNGGGNRTSQGQATNNGQLLDNLLSTVVRIVPDTDNDGGYTVPVTNPYHNNALFGDDDTVGNGLSDPCPEIIAIGLRNPYRMSIDGDRVYLGDVGAANEEIDAFDYNTGALVNFAWRLDNSDKNETNIQAIIDGDSALVGDYVPPILWYTRGGSVASAFRADDPDCNNCGGSSASVIIGDVYRGSVYGGALNGRLMHSEFMDGFARAAPVAAYPLTGGAHLIHRQGISAMVQGPQLDNFVYVVAQADGYYVSGEHMIYRLVRPSR